MNQAVERLSDRPINYYRDWHRGRFGIGFGRIGPARDVFLGVVLWLVLMGISGCRNPDATIDFNRDIRPVLNANCVGCHGGVHRESELSLLFRDEALQPAKSGKAALVPGDPDGSELILRITHADPSQRMPRDRPALSSEVIARFKEWIRNGAEWQPHWAYVPPDPEIVESERLPDVSQTDWPLNEIDRFVLARLEEEGMRPSEQAECTTLVRRASLDLTGLPPTFEDVDYVCADVDTRYPAFVDTLLARPAFGERWAAMWLDLARYADSQGYEADHYRSIWRYRDWVVDAFNSDMPFDRFTVEQLAGDLLPNSDPTQRIATAFSRNSMTNTEGGTDDEEHRYAAIIDRVNTTWEVWQGTSFGCAQCHGHPYDPIKQEEYYKALAFFNNTADWDQSDERPVMFEFDPEHAETGSRLVEELETVEAAISEAVREPQERERLRDWERRLGDREVIGRVPNTRQNKLLRIVKIPEEERTGRQQDVVEIMYSDVAETLAPLREKRRSLLGDISGLKAVSTPVMQELSEGERRRTFVFDRGNFLVPLEEVDPGVPISMPPLPNDAPRDRLGFAEWIVSPDNPLTARVIVNRFWEQLFGLGIVETLEDFGTQGLSPTHPELLDWLSVTFRDVDGWSTKSLLRRIVLSATYRQVSTVTDEHLARDPRNLLLARSPRVRLSAEQIRDQALAVSGLLSPKMHGPSVMPYQPDGIWQNPYSGAKWETAAGEDRYRRALYTYWRRTAPYPAMVSFDSPTREFCVSRRSRTNTPLQALVTLNDPAHVEAAQALARAMFEAAMSADAMTGESRDFEREAVRFGFRRALSRLPDSAAEDVLLELYRTTLTAYRSDATATALVTTVSIGPEDREVSNGSSETARTPDEDAARLAALTVVANAIMNLDEFITRG